MGFDNISKEHFSKAEKMAKFGSWRIDFNNHTVVATDSAADIYGLKNRVFSIDEIKKIPLPEYRSILDAELAKIISGSGNYDIEYQIKRVDDGRIRWIHSTAEYDKEENVVTGIIQDITVQKRLETALADSEKRYRSLFDNSASGIIYSDLDGNVLEANKKILHLLGSPSLEETMKINLLNFKSLVDVGFSADLKKALDTAEPVYNLINYQSKWGVRLYLEYYLTPILDEGRVVGVMAKIEDITERKNAEDKVEALLKEKDIILREVHHRIKNNMASIESLLMIQRANFDSEEICDVLNDAVSRLSSMRILYEKLYQSEDFMETSAKAYFNKLIDEIAGVFPQSDDITIEKNLQDFMIPSDIVFSLGIIINELITNAMKYAFTSAMEEKLIRINAEKVGTLVKIVIRDNGIGIAESKKIKQGSFGLQLINMLADQIGGKADFYNDNGAVFSISFNV